MVRRQTRTPRRSLAISTGLALITALSIGSAAPAFAAEGCDDTTTSGTLVVTLVNGDLDATISVDGTPTVTVGGVSGCTTYTGITTVSVVTDLPANDTDEMVTFEDPGSSDWSGIARTVSLGDDGPSGDRITLNGTADDDMFDTSFIDTISGVEHFTLDGGDGDDTLSGGATDDTIYGDEGIDAVSGGDGDDLVDGGPDMDLVDGDAGDDVIHGGDDAADDVLYGGTGDDVFDECGGTGETGADDIFGEDGVDTVDYSARANTVTVTLDSGAADDGESGEGDDIVTVENVLGGTGDDSLTGNAGNNFLYGGPGDDDLYGLSGNDLLEGGAGGDTLDGGDLIDTITYANAAVGVTVNLGSNTFSADEAAGDTATAVENIIGSDGEDTLTGSAGSNVIWGRDTGDHLYGEAGRDTLYGEDGVDDLHGDQGGDVLYGGSGDDNLYGNADGDTLRGGSGNDSMEGNAGNDSLFGEAGVDNRGWFCDDTGGNISGTKDKANFSSEDGYTKAQAKAIPNNGCESFAGSYSRT